MSAPSSSSIGGIDQSHLLCLRLIGFVVFRVFRVYFVFEFCSTFIISSGVYVVGGGGGEVIQGINFDSEEYGKLMMRGLILSQPICHAIGAFHKAQIQS